MGFCQEIILEDPKREQHAGLRWPFNAQAQRINPAGGDEVTVRIQPRGGSRPAKFGVHPPAQRPDRAAARRSGRLITVPQETAPHRPGAHAHTDASAAFAPATATRDGRAPTVREGATP